MSSFLTKVKTEFNIKTDFVLEIVFATPSSAIWRINDLFRFEDILHALFCECLCTTTKLTSDEPTFEK